MGVLCRSIPVSDTREWFVSSNWHRARQQHRSYRKRGTSGWREHWIFVRSCWHDKKEEEAATGNTSHKSWQIRLQSLVFYFSFNVVFVAVVVCLFVCLFVYLVTVLLSLFSLLFHDLLIRYYSLFHVQCRSPLHTVALCTQIWSFPAKTVQSLSKNSPKQ